MHYQFITKEGIWKIGLLWTKYKSPEGEMRYLFFCEGKEYQCIIRKDGRFVEM